MYIPYINLHSINIYPPEKNESGTGPVARTNQEQPGYIQLIEYKKIISH